MNKIAVGILCGRGESVELVQTIAACRFAGHTGPIVPLFGVQPTSRFKGTYLLFPPAAENKRGLARTTLVQQMFKLHGPHYDLFVFLDDDTAPQEGYFGVLAHRQIPHSPVLMGGKLLNADGLRSWDVCSFRGKDPVVVPYQFWDHPTYNAGLYLSGPQHIFNKPGLELAARIEYPDMVYGEDTNFCFRFTESGGSIVFIPEITARLTHQHKPPNEVMFANSV